MQYYSDGIHLGNVERADGEQFGGVSSRLGVCTVLCAAPDASSND